MHIIYTDIFRFKHQNNFLKYAQNWQTFSYCSPNKVVLQLQICYIAVLTLILELVSATNAPVI